MHVALEQAAGVGVREHDRGDVGAELRLQRREIDAAAFVRRDFLDGEADERRGRGVRAVRGFGHEDDVALFAAALRARP